MASTLVKSIRISPETWAGVETEAKRRGLSPNAFLVLCVNAVLADMLPRMSDDEVGEVMRSIKPPTEKAAKKFFAGERWSDAEVAKITAKASAPFRGVTSSGEPLPERKPYQKTGKTK